MYISKSCNLVLSNLYFYDIQACFYNLLSNIDWELKNIPVEDKLQRNIRIGYLQKNNPDLGVYLRETSNRIIDYYINKNKVMLEQIIVRQRDGLILTVPLKDFNSSIELKFRETIYKMIIDVRRHKYLTIGSNGVTVKGVPNKPIDISFYDMFSNIDFSSKQKVIFCLDKIRRNVLLSDNISWFAFKRDDNYVIPITNAGEIIINKDVLEFLETDDIDKTIIWNNYIWDFVQPLILYCL